MTRNGTLPVTGQGKVSAMKNWRYVDGAMVQPAEQEIRALRKE